MSIRVADDDPGLRDLPRHKLIEKVHDGDYLDFIFEYAQAWFIFWLFDGTLDVQLWCYGPIDPEVSAHVERVEDEQGTVVPWPHGEGAGEPINFGYARTGDLLKDVEHAVDIWRAYMANPSKLVAEIDKRNRAGRFLVVNRPEFV